MMIIDRMIGMAEHELGQCEFDEDWCTKHQSWSTGRNCSHMINVISMMRKAYMLGANV